MGRGAMPPPLRAAAHFFNNSDGKSTMERMVSDFLRSWLFSADFLSPSVGFTSF